MAAIASARMGVEAAWSRYAPAEVTAKSTSGASDPSPLNRGSAPE